MRQVNILTDTSNVEYWFEINGLKLEIPYVFDSCLDLANMAIYKPFETTKFPTIESLIKKGVGAFKFGYAEHSFTYAEEDPKVNTDEVIKFFKSVGYNVTEAAILHNYIAWKQGFKSGFLDEQNGYHLFTPCGGNLLRFTLTSLCPAADWQTTYKW